MSGFIGFQRASDWPGRDFVSALDSTGVVDTLVATLHHESPHCVAAAARALCPIGAIEGGGQALIEASGAIPALVRVIEKARPPSDPVNNTTLFRRCARLRSSVLACACLYEPACICDAMAVTTSLGCL
jgi:hypothetical protein